MREDIIGSLKNALERGATMKQAIQSLINSGYNDVEVREAANQMSPGAISTLSPKLSAKPAVPINSSMPPPQKLPTPLVRQPIRQSSGKRVSSRKMGNIILLLIILIILIGVLGATIIFRDQVIGFLTDLF